MGTNDASAASGVVAIRSGGRPRWRATSAPAASEMVSTHGRPPRGGVQEPVQPPAAQVVLGPHQRRHVVHADHRRDPGRHRGAVDRERVDHVGAGAAQVERQQQLLGQVGGPRRQRRAAHGADLDPGRALQAVAARPAAGAQRDQLAAALGGHLRQGPEEALGVAAYALPAQVGNVQRPGVDYDPQAA